MVVFTRGYYATVEQTAAVAILNLMADSFPEFEERFLRMPPHVVYELTDAVVDMFDNVKKEWSYGLRHTNDEFQEGYDGYRDGQSDIDSGMCKVCAKREEDARKLRRVDYQRLIKISDDDCIESIR